MRKFFILRRMPMMRFRSRFQSSWKRCLEIQPLSPTILPSSAAVMVSKGLRSSVLPAVILTAMTSPLLLMTMCSLKPKNQPMVLRPRVARPSKTLFSVDPLVVADSELCGIHEIDTIFFTAKALKQYAQWQHHPGHQCHKTTVAWQTTKAIAVFLVYAKVPESLEILER